MTNNGHITANLGAYQPALMEGLETLRDERIIERIWRQDYTVWKPEPAEVSNRLGWLYIWEEMIHRIGQLEALAYAARQNGLRQAVLLGMGGSSLAPELFSRMFPGSHDALELRVLDSSDPEALSAIDSQIDYTQTLFFVSTKSGGTVETFSFMKYFYRKAVAALGAGAAGEHFIAITDPGSNLADIAKAYRFRTILLNDPNIGGRYSALSYFGLGPAAFTGVDLHRLLRSTMEMASACRGSQSLEENPAAVLGAILGCLANRGRNKITFLLPPLLASFGDWVEQLIAESTGKEGKGILPVVGEGLFAPENYGDDRIFVQITLSGESRNDHAVQLLQECGHPIIRLEISDLYGIGGQFLLWEMATAITGYFLGTNPFDQPNVESAKELARQMVAAYQLSGVLPQPKPDLLDNGIQAFGTHANSLQAALTELLAKGRPGDYIAIQAFLPPMEATSRTLQILRRNLLERTHLATTVGYGPRFLHSTGQLHKGDGGSGLFIQLTTSSPQDVPIPDEMNSTEASLTFGVLKSAQALGDLQALRDAGRRVVRFHIDGDVEEGIHKLTDALGESSGMVLDLGG